MFLEERVRKELPEVTFVAMLPYAQRLADDVDCVQVPQELDKVVPGVLLEEGEAAPAQQAPPRPAAINACPTRAALSTAEPTAVTAFVQQMQEQSSMGSASPDVAEAAQGAAPLQQAHAQAAAARARVPVAMELGSAPLDACKRESMDTVRTCVTPAAALLLSARINIYVIARPLVLRILHVAG